MALRSQANGEQRHREEGETRDQRSGVAAAGTDEPADQKGPQENKKG